MPIPKLSFSELRTKIASALKSDRVSYEITSNDETVAILVVPQNDYVKQVCLVQAQMSNVTAGVENGPKPKDGAPCQRE